MIGEGFDGRPMCYDRQGQPMGFMEWAKAFEDTESRVVAQTVVGSVRVSTVWLGLNHNFDGETPLIFETMVFGGPMDQEPYRWATEDEARSGHEMAVAAVRLQQDVSP